MWVAGGISHAAIASCINHIQIQVKLSHLSLFGVRPGSFYHINACQVYCQYSVLPWSPDRIIKSIKSGPHQCLTLPTL